MPGLFLGVVLNDFDAFQLAADRLDHIRFFHRLLRLDAQAEHHDLQIVDVHIFEIGIDPGCLLRLLGLDLKPAFGKTDVFESGLIPDNLRSRLFDRQIILVVFYAGAGVVDPQFRVQMAYQTT